MPAALLLIDNKLSLFHERGFAEHTSGTLISVHRCILKMQRTVDEW